MYVDSRFLLADSQSTTATAVTTNAVPLADLPTLDGHRGNIGAGKPLYMVFCQEQAPVVAANDITVQFQVVIDNAVALSSPVSIATSWAYEDAYLQDLSVGIIVLPIPPISQWAPGADGPDWPGGAGGPIMEANWEYLGGRFLYTGTTATTPGIYTVTVVEAYHDASFYPVGWSFP